MTRPDHDERAAAPVLGRRSLLKLGGGFLGLLVFPELASAAVKRVAAKPVAKVAKASAKATAKSAKASRGGEKVARGAKHGSDARVADRGRAAGRHYEKESSRRVVQADRAHAAKKVEQARAAEAPRVQARVAAPEPRPRIVAAADPVIEPAAPRVIYDRAPAIVSPRGQTRGARSIALYNPHTCESVNVDYFIDGRYDRESLEEIDRVLRDYHTDEIIPIDPAVIDQVHLVRGALDSTEAFNIYSGYRSPETNAAARRMRGGVAEHSYHVRGKAIDLNLPGRDLRQVRMAALSLETGGVGYYPWAGFVHVDSGPIRRW
ncbi:MAG: DUF882 domain-containing protein [Alphaproteobacteria bacterium]